MAEETQAFAMKKKIILFLILSSIFLSSNVFSQKDNCKLILLDSNNLRKTFNDISLISCYSDTLKYFNDSETGNTYIGKLISLSYTVDSKSPKGMIIGAATGLGVYVAIVALLSVYEGGHPDFSVDLNFKGAVIGGLIFTFIGGILGGIFQSPEKTIEKIDFTELTLKQRRERIKNIFKYYDKRNIE